MKIKFNHYQNNKDLKVFCTPGPNLVIFAWTGDKLWRGQADDWRTHMQTHIQRCRQYLRAKNNLRKTPDYVYRYGSAGVLDLKYHSWIENKANSKGIYIYMYIYIHQAKSSICMCICVNKRKVKTKIKIKVIIHYAELKDNHLKHCFHKGDQHTGDRGVIHSTKYLETIGFNSSNQMYYITMTSDWYWST